MPFSSFPVARYESEGRVQRSLTLIDLSKMHERRQKNRPAAVYADWVPPVCKQFKSCENPTWFERT